MKKLTALLLAMVMVIGLFAGCATQPATPTTPNTEPGATEPDATAPDATDPVIGEGNGEFGTVSFISVTYSPNMDTTEYVMITATEAGADVFYEVDVKKVGVVDIALMDDVTASLQNSGLMALNGTEEYAEGDSAASLYAEDTNGNVISINYSGAVAEEFVTGYQLLKNDFASLTAEMPEYVAQVSVGEGVDEAHKEALLTILNNSGIQGLDGLMLNPVAEEEYQYGLGLSSAEGVVNGTSCTAMMITTAYSIALVTLEEGADASAVCADFEKNLDWGKWVCVMPTDALIATKDNMVMCVIGADEMFSLTAASAEAAGWTTVKELKNEM